jgi:hypothetical protein
MKNNISVKYFITKNLIINDNLLLKYYNPQGNTSKENPQTDIIGSKKISFYIDGHHVQGDVDLYAKFNNDKTWTLIYTMEGDH